MILLVIAGVLVLPALAGIVVEAVHIRSAPPKPPSAPLMIGVVSGFAAMCFCLYRALDMLTRTL